MTDTTEHTGDIHASYLHWVADASPYRLAELADCGAPDSRTSLGAEILTEVRDAVVSRWRTGSSGNGFDWETDNNDGGLIRECADEGIIPLGSHDRALLFVDLCAYAEVNEHTMYGEWGPGSFEDLMVEAIGQICYRLADALVTEVRKDFRELWECPGCGDTGEPHRCLPGMCNGSDEDRADHAARMAAQVAAEAVQAAPAPQDPILTLIAEHEAERAQQPSDTQAFMAYMGRVNVEEFGKASKPFGWSASRWVLVISVVVAALVAVAWVVAR